MTALPPADFIRKNLPEGIRRGLTEAQAFEFLCLRWEREHGKDPEWPPSEPGTPIVRLPRLQ